MTFEAKYQPEEVLTAIAQYANDDGKVRVSDLAAILGVHKKTLKSYLDPLEEQGLVKQEYNKKEQGRPGYVEVVS